jgi:two-component system, NarL family, response regulator
MTVRKSIRVLCVDDHPMVREGLATMINRQPDMGVVASAGTAEKGVELFRELHPDVVLMDLQLPGMSGLDAIRAIRAEQQDARIVVITVYQGEEDVWGALRAGATTYLLKDTVSDDLVRVVREVHAGRRPIPETVQRLLNDREHQPKLSPRENAVLRLIAEGKQNKEIAHELGISFETAKIHVGRILTKLGVRDRTAAVAVAVKRGLLRVN